MRRNEAKKSLINQYQPVCVPAYSQRRPARFSIQTTMMSEATTNLKEQ